jgi:hypothetical protein
MEYDNRIFNIYFGSISLGRYNRYWNHHDFLIVYNVNPPLSEVYFIESIVKTSIKITLQSVEKAKKNSITNAANILSV